MKRLRMICVVVGIVLVSACACKGGSKDTGPGDGNGTGPPRCDAIKQHVSELYRAETTGEATAEMIEEQVADNTQMVMNDCAEQPDKVAPCAAKATTVADLEERCLIPLDAEGSEGDRFGKGTGKGK